MSERVGIVGYGRFGRAIGEMCAEAGVRVHAWDVAGVEGAVGAGSMSELAAQSDVLLIAVPIGAMRRVFEALRAHVGSAHVVADVASVKVLPSQWMSASFGTAVPWVATHPLFGPTSLMLGERPLRVVVCPSAEHGEAVERMAGLYERLGCEVVRQDAESHDRAMAETHALAYFVAKGMLDAGVKLDAENAPPSSQAILRTVDAVRSDAGHLFAALHLDNPYAEAVRERFLGALSRIDRALREAGPDDDETESAALSIPDLGERSPEIREVRDLIDDIDRSIVGLLARRALMARRAAKAKAGLGVGIRDPRREYNLLSERRAWAESSGLDPDAIEALFESILRWSRKLQADS